jgi:glycosyltransferase involved in cell wall biosynthesis
VGTLGYRKGTDILLRAVDQLVKDLPFELVLIGAANEALIKQMKGIVSPELWRRVVFKKNQLPAEVAKELASAALLILPTRADTSPNAVKESVVAGLPVVASAIGGIPDYVFPGENGVLFPAGDLAECVRAIRAACQHPLFSRGLVDAKSLERNRDYLSPARMAKNFLAAYQFVLNPDPGVASQPPRCRKLR